MPAVCVLCDVVRNIVACMQSAELLMLPHVKASCIQQSQTSLCTPWGLWTPAAREQPPLGLAPLHDDLASHTAQLSAILGSIGASNTTASQ